MQLYVFSVDNPHSALAIHELRMHIELWIKSEHREMATPYGVSNHHIGRVFFDAYLAAPVSQDFNLMLKDYEWCTCQKVANRDHHGELQHLTDMGVAQVLLVKRMRDLHLEVWGTTPMVWATSGWSSDSTICKEMQEIQEATDGSYAKIVAEVIREHAIDHGFNILVTTSQIAGHITSLVCDAKVVDMGRDASDGEGLSLLDQIYRDLILQATYEQTKKHETYVIQHLEHPMSLVWPTDLPEDEGAWMTAWEKGLNISHDCPFEPNADLIRNLKQVADGWLSFEK